MKTITKALVCAVLLALAILAAIFCRPIRNAYLTVYGKLTYPDFVEVTKYGTIIEGRNVHTIKGEHYYGLIPPSNEPIPSQPVTGTTADGQEVCPDDEAPIGGCVDAGWD